MRIVVELLGDEANAIERYRGAHARVLDLPTLARLMIRETLMSVGELPRPKRVPVERRKIERVRP